jgi:hypothetical protein
MILLTFVQWFKVSFLCENLKIKIHPVLSLVYNFASALLEEWHGNEGVASIP